MVLINCGGTIDLLGLLEPQSGTRLIVVDSHRPIHHNLIHSLDDHAVVICEDDDLHPQTELPAPDGASEEEQEDEEEARPTSRCKSKAHMDTPNSQPTKFMQRFYGFDGAMQEAVRYGQRGWSPKERRSQAAAAEAPAPVPQGLLQPWSILGPPCHSDNAQICPDPEAGGSALLLVSVILLFEIANVCTRGYISPIYTPVSHKH